MELKEKAIRSIVETAVDVFADTFAERHIGIHFTLVKGSPVLPPSEIKSLVNLSSGNFYDDFSVFVKRYLTGRIDFYEVRAELSAQAEKIQNSELKISHVDSHQHLHVLPKIFSIVSDLAQKLKIRAMRIPFVNQFTVSPSKTALKILASRAKNKAEKSNFAVPDNFWGIIAGESIRDIFVSQCSHYLTWSGRFFALGLCQFFILIGKKFFNIINTAVFISITFLIYLLGAGKTGFDFISFDLILWILFCFWFCVPSLLFTTIWLCGSCVYLFMAVVQSLFILPYAMNYFIPCNFNLVIIIILGLLTGLSNEFGGAGVFFLSCFFIINSFIFKSLSSWQILVVAQNDF